MQVQTRGIILNHIKYGEQSLIVHILSKHHGVSSYMIHAPRSKKSKLKKAVIQPLQILDYVCTYKNKGTIERISEVSKIEPLHGIGTDIIKSSLAMFMGELLYKVLKDEEMNEALFEFLERYILVLNETEEPLADAPIILMNKLSYHLGMMPSTEGNGDYFDLREGVFISSPRHTDVLGVDQSILWRQSIEDLQKGERIGLNSAQRAQNLEDWLLYFKIQRFDFGPLKSLDVLKEIFN